MRAGPQFDAPNVRRQWRAGEAVRVHCTPGLGDAVKVRRGVERRERQESPEGGAAGGAGLPPCRPKGDAGRRRLCPGGVTSEGGKGLKPCGACYGSEEATEGPESSECRDL